MERLETHAKRKLEQSRAAAQARKLEFLKLRSHHDKFIIATLEANASQENAASELSNVDLILRRLQNLKHTGCIGSAASSTYAMDAHKEHFASFTRDLEAKGAQFSPLPPFHV